MSDSGKQVMSVVAKFLIWIFILFVVLSGWVFKSDYSSPVNLQL